jgi:HTH-type transcriptional regulator / antitoxin HigA
MAKTMLNEFAPDYAVHPGEILKETLEARKIKSKDLAERCGLSEKTVSLIVNGKAPIEPETAMQLERVLGVSAAIWNNLDASYRLHKAEAAARSEFAKQKKWTDRFPLKELIRRKIIEKPADTVDAVGKLLNFFAVGSISAWEKQFEALSVAYRSSKSFENAPESVATWLRIGELISESIETEPYDDKKFRSSLDEIRKLTNEQPEIFIPKMKKLCAYTGVALVFVSELPGTHLSGAARWLNSEKALIMLSLRHKTDDHFWFSFFHEAAHILLQRRKELFLDDSNENVGEFEKQADKFASNLLIPANEYVVYFNKSFISDADIRQFSRRYNIAPGIVVGRLQHDGKSSFKYHNSLKRSFCLVESEAG